MSTAVSSAEAERSPELVSDGHLEQTAQSVLGPVDRLRIFVKVVAIVAGTGVLAGFLALAWIPTLPFRRSGSRWRARIRQPVFRTWGRGMLRTLGVRVAVEGNPPPAGAMIVSNHLSYLDIATLASLLPAVFVSKAEVERWPFWGTMARMGGTIFIDRGRSRDTVRVLSEIEAAFHRGDSVVIFPEATSTDGSAIIPFKSSLLASAATQGNPVHWLTVSYRTPVQGDSARDHVCWWGDAAFLPHFLGLCRLRRIEARVTFGDTPVQAHDRKVLANTLRHAMLTRFTPIT